MLKIKVNELKPVKKPPKTVDILGLTERQAGQLLSLLGSCPADGDDLSGLYNGLLASGVVGVGYYYGNFEYSERNKY